MNVEDLNIGLIGLGRLGTVIGKELVSHGLILYVVLDSNPAKLDTFSAITGFCFSGEEDCLDQCDVIFVCVEDRNVPGVIQRICQRISLKPGVCVIHTSGVLGLTESDHGTDRELHFGKMHPLASFPSRFRPDLSLNRVWFALDGDTHAMNRMVQLIDKFGACWFELKNDHRVKYHLAAVIASNFIVALAHMSINILKTCDITQEQAHAGIISLMESVMKNLKTTLPSEALSGPVIRGDTDTIRDHLNELSTHFPEYGLLYATLTELTIELAESSRHVSVRDMEWIRLVLEEFRKKGNP